MLEVGKHLVTQLGLEDSTDTLGRWLSHHVAELIETAEKPEAGMQERAEAVDVILKIWQHRDRVPAKVSPLASYADLLQVLSVFVKEAGPWAVHQRDPRGLSLSTLYSRFHYLICLLLLTKLPSKQVASTPTAVRKLLSKTESTLLRLLERRLDLFDSSNGRAVPTLVENRRMAADLIGRMIVDLQKLEKGLTTATAAPSRPRSVSKIKNSAKRT